MTAAPNLPGGTAFQRLTDALTRHGSRVTTKGDRNALAQCPAHEDRNPSLSLTAIEGQTLLHCFAGCQPESILTALNLGLGDLYDEPRTTYRYTDHTGRPTRTVHRWYDPNGKRRFMQSGHDQDTPPQLYRLPKVVQAARDAAPIYIVEGEKDVHAAEALGAVATTSPMGASNWRKVDVRPLTGAHVILVPDQDEAGSKYLDDVLETLNGIAATIRVGSPRAGKDLADHVAAGYTLEQLDAQPVLSPDERMLAVDTAHELRKMRARRAARDVLNAEDAEAVPIPNLIRLDEFLARPLPPITHRIEGLWPAGGRVLLAAQFKAGKTTLRDNMMRSLVDGHDFLGVHKVEPPDGPVILLDFELDEHTLQRWLQDQQFENPDRVHLVSMKGKVGSFNILDPTVRARWVDTLTSVGAYTVVIDCLRPILDALGLSEDKDAGRFLVALDDLMGAAEAPELFVVHHMGHGAERSRGDSRLRDWPDAEWRLVRDKEVDDPTLDDLHGARYFSAFGRDVDHAQAELVYEKETRWLTLKDGPVTNRREASIRRRSEKAMDIAYELIVEVPGVNKRSLRAECRARGAGENTVIDEALEMLIQQGLVRRVEGGGRTGSSHSFFPIHGSSVPSVPSVPKRAERAESARWPGTDPRRGSATCGTLPPQDARHAQNGTVPQMSNQDCRLCGKPLTAIRASISLTCGNCQPATETE